MSENTPDTRLSDAMSRLDEVLLQTLSPAAGDLVSLHHYTSIDVLLKILTAEGLHSSSLHYLNDPEEYAFSKRLISQVSNNEIYSEVLTHNSSGGIYSLLGFKHERRDIFVTCFTEDGDSLPFWIAYGANARGVSIQYPHGVLKSLHRSHLIKVVYDEETAIQIVRDFLGRAIDIRLTLDVEQQRWFGDYVDYGLHLLCASIKRPEYAHEREWRIVSLESPFNDEPLVVDYRSNGKWLIPYTFTRICRPESIQCGPLAEYDLLAPVLNRIYGQTAINFGSIARRSQVHYRG